MAFPTNFDNVPATAAGNQTNNAASGVGLPALLNDLANAVNNAQTYLGIIGSAVTSSITYQINNLGTSNLVNGAITAVKLAVSSPTSSQLSGLDGVNYGTNLLGSWITSPTTYTYSSFSAPSIVLTPTADPTGYLDKGNVFQFTITGANAGTYTGYITAVSSSSVTVILDSSVNALATGTVSTVSFSKTIPHGFNPWLNSAGTPTWGGTPPTTTVNTLFRFMILGRQVTLYIFYEYSSAGSSNTNVFFPVPVVPVGVSTSYANPLYAHFSTAGSGTTPTTAGFGNIYNSASIYAIPASSIAAKCVWVGGTYQI